MSRMSNLKEIEEWQGWGALGTLETLPIGIREEKSWGRELRKGLQTTIPDLGGPPISKSGKCRC